MTLPPWPDGSPETFCTDNFRCRYKGTGVTPKQIVALLDRVNGLFLSGKYAEGLPIAKEASGRAAALSYRPTQAEALTMLAVQVIANDVAVGFGGAGGYLEMNVYKPLIIYNVTHSIAILADGCTNFRKFLVEGTKPNLKKINEYVERSLMLVTALSPVIGYDKASKIAHYAMDNDLTLKAAALKLGFVTEAEFDRVVDPKKMVTPYVATAAA